MFDAVFPPTGFPFWRPSAKVGRAPERVRSLRVLADEAREIEQSFISRARMLFPLEAETDEQALELLQRWADVYEADRAHREIVDRMEQLLQRPAVRRGNELKQSTRLRMEMWRAARAYVDWRRRWEEAADQKMP